MKNLILTEEERNEILSMHKNATNRQYLTEQENFKYEFSFKSPEALEIYKIFNTKFLPTIIQGYFNMTPPQATDAFNKLTDEQLSGAIRFFTENGYKQPNNPKIMKFQQELMENTNIKTFTNLGGNAKKFDDGTFGIATAKAVLELKKSSFLKLPKDKTLEQLSFNTRKSNDVIQAPKVKTVTNIDIQKGIQPIK